LIGEVLEAENGTQGLIRQVLGNQQETQDLIRKSTQNIMDGFKEVNRNIEELANQMNSVKIDLSRLIKTGVLQVSYLKDLEHFDLFSQRFEEMERDSSGLIVKNRKVEEFKRVVNDDLNGAERTYTDFHTMAVGGGLLGQKSIFEIDSTYCSSKDYILYVMIRLFEFEATAKAMDGRALDPVKIEKFKQMCINVEQKHIQTCGCPPDGPAQQMRNLQQLLSQPSPRTSAAEFYDSIIGNDQVGCDDLPKVHLLYKTKPFDFSPSILSAIKSQPIEVLELVFNLVKHGNLDTLPLLENKLICTKGPIPVLVRKQVGNPPNYFDKSFREYQEGFSANGESWLGLDRLHRLTSKASFGLKITLTDFNGEQFTAAYDNFKIGPRDSYTLSVGGFNATLSTLDDAMRDNNGAKFSTRDRDSRYHWYHCAKRHTGGWWYVGCGLTHLTGQHTKTRATIGGGLQNKQIFYYHGGERGNTYDSWAEAEMVLVPN